MINNIQMGQLENGKYSWEITASEIVGASYPENTQAKPDTERLLAEGDEYDTPVEALGAIFSIFFGSYDDSFLTLYRAWVESKPEFADDAALPEPTAVIKTVEVESIGASVQTGVAMPMAAKEIREPEEPISEPIQVELSFDNGPGEPR